MDDFSSLITLRQQGFYCSQILMLQGLDMLGKSNPDLVRAMHGLAGGLGFSGELCGALTGGASLLGLYAGKGTPEQPEDPRLDFMTVDLVNWFKETYAEQFGGIRCAEILAGNLQNQAIRCPILVTGVLQKVKDLLVENGYDLSGLDNA
ncbi:MAG TPA: C-GCAxxG-C-C family protein [Anaerolineales bacterium]|nr:C-GCAxxG-C-C family protein [Anaerolineales bacterium]